MKRSHHRFFELLPLVPQETGDGREGKLFVSGDRLILKFSLLMMSPSWSESAHGKAILLKGYGIQSVQVVS